MKLNKDLLEDQYSSCLEARGLYNSMQFVLRLRYDQHNLMDSIKRGEQLSSQLSFEQLQAYSTFFHETIHWWQHIGSITGLMLSLSYPAQSHMNHNHLMKYLQDTGAIKPISKYNIENATEFAPSSSEFMNINYILNNFHDIEFFKLLITNPVDYGKAVANNPLFESKGHSYFIAYSSALSVISASVDRAISFIPNAENWQPHFDYLREQGIQDHVHGKTLMLPPLGALELFEGQARFIQIQFLYFSSNNKLSWTDFEELGMLNGVYIKAFEVFLQSTNSDWPDKIDDPIVALFLLVIDLSINPPNGFVFDIKQFDKFVVDVEPGTRFLKYSLIIRDREPELKSKIIHYSKEEYFEISNILCGFYGEASPQKILKKIKSWSIEDPQLVSLLLEDDDFNFELGNQPIRVIFARFMKFQLDKLEQPQLFCWPSIFKAGNKVSPDFLEIFNEHTALFSDKSDGDIYPKVLKGRSKENIQATFDTFYTWVAVYDLTRQWIIDEGEFDYHFTWLSSKHSNSEFKEWANTAFYQTFNINLDNFSYL